MTVNGVLEVHRTIYWHRRQGTTAPLDGWLGILSERHSPGVREMVEDIEKASSRVRIESSKEKPDDPFIAVKYRGHWFYIDDRDFRSKRMFTLLLFIFTLAETGAPEKAPILTIPTG